MSYTVYAHRTSGGFPNKIKGVLFDMDGLVLDTEKLYTRFWMEAAQALGYPMTRQQALGMRSLSKAAGQAQLERYFGPGVSHARIRAERIVRMEAFIDRYGVEPKPGIDQLLNYLKAKGIATAITTSSPMERIHRYLGPLGLDTRFDRLCSGYDVPNGKPEPDIYLYGAASVGLKPEECLALEDSPAGIESAYRAGCVPVMIPDGDQPSQETVRMLYAKADTLLDVIGLLER